MIKIKKLVYTNKNKINWKIVEKDLDRFVDKSYINKVTNKNIFIDRRSIDEITHSNYTVKLKGKLRLIKANVVLHIEDIINDMNNVRWKKDIGDKHKNIAKYGWNRYDIRFLFPMRNERGEFVDMTEYKATCVVRISDNNKLYLYDIIDIKKETGGPHRMQSHKWYKPISLLEYYHKMECKSIYKSKKVTKVILIYRKVHNY